MKSHSIPNNIDEFIKIIASDKMISPNIRMIAEFVIENRGKNLQDIVEICIQNGMAKHTLIHFNRIATSQVKDLIINSNPELLTKSRDEIIKRAEEKRIYLTNSENSLFGSTKNTWFYKPVKISNISEFTKTERLLSFVNCLMEFCFEEALFKREDPKHSTSCLRKDGERPVSFRELQEEASRKAAFKQDTINKNLFSEGDRALNANTQITKETVLTPEESFLQELWQKGYLQCDLIH